MNEHEDIEEIMKRFQHEPDPRVRERIMAAYEASYANGRGPARLVFWKRRIPLYAAITALVIAAGLSFIAGQRLGGSKPRSLSGAATSDAITWSVAESDIL